MSKCFVSELTQNVLLRNVVEVKKWLDVGVDDFRFTVLFRLYSDELLKYFNLAMLHQCKNENACNVLLKSLLQRVEHLRFACFNEVLSEIMKKAGDSELLMSIEISDK